MKRHCPEPETLACFLEGKLSESDRESVLDHAADCSGCRRHLAVGSLPQTALRTTSTGRRRSTRRTAKPVRRRASWTGWVAAAAAILIGALAVFVLRDREPSPVDEPLVVTPPPSTPKPEPKPVPVVPAPSPKIEKPAPPKPVVPKPEPPKPAPPKVEKPVPPPPPPPVKPAPVQPKPEPKKPAPKPAPAAPKETRIAVAEVTGVEGRVSIVSGEKKIAVKAGEKILAGQAIVSEGGGSRLEISYPDGTKLVLKGDTSVRGFHRDAGKWIHVERGFVVADVAKQPKDQPMIFATPQAEATVLGTTLRLGTLGDRTTLKVDEGRVRLKRLSDGKSILVSSGQIAVSAEGVPMKIRRPTGLVGRWSFDEDSGTIVPDSSGNGFHGVLKGDAVRVDSRLGKAMKFTGRGSVDIAEFDVVAGDVTLALWVYHETLGNHVDMYAAFTPETGSFQLMREGVRGVDRVRVNCSTPESNRLVDGLYLKAGEWTHLAVQKDVKNVQLFVNGRPVKKLPSVGNLARFVSLRIGQIEGAILDDVRVYDRILSRGELRNVMGGATVFGTRFR